LASPADTLQTMRAVITTDDTLRSPRPARRDLLLETLALRHQLGVLARSNKRFRAADRLLWLLLRWLWPKWRDALVLIQPGTVNRWHREGVWRCWRRNTRRRPGRPRIDPASQELILRLAAENCLWGAPRIHGELLKIGIAVSERTVSRHLECRPTPRSQTWRTFFANHVGGQILTSPMMFADATHQDGVVDVSDLLFRPASSADGSYASHSQTDRDFGYPLRASSLGVRPGQQHLQECTGPRTITGRDPPRYLRLEPTS